MRFNFDINLTSNTPIQVSSLFTTGGPPFIADRVSIQMLKGGSGVGYVMDGIPKGTTPAGKGTGAGQLTMELNAASAGAAGGQYEDIRSPTDGWGIDLTQLWVDGDQNDPVAISGNRRV